MIIQFITCFECPSMAEGGLSALAKEGGVSGYRPAVPSSVGPDSTETVMARSATLESSRPARWSTGDYALGRSLGDDIQRPGCRHSRPAITHTLGGYPSQSRAVEAPLQADALIGSVAIARATSSSSGLARQPILMATTSGLHMLELDAEHGGALDIIGPFGIDERKPKF